MLQCPNYFLTRSIALLWVICSTVGCKGGIASEPLVRLLEIDGDETDWGETRLYLEEIQGSLGIVNDSKHLYLVLGLTDPDLQRLIFARGFTIWLDPKGKKNRTFGIRFPLGLPEEGIRPVERNPMTPPRDRFIGGKQLETMFDRSTGRREFELIGPNPHQKRRLSLESGDPVQLAVAFTNYRLVYEAKIPLSEVYGRNGDQSKPSQTLGLGFETGKFDFAARREQMQGRRGGRGMGGGFGGGGSGRGPFAGGGRRNGNREGIAQGSRLGPLELWTRVKLAAPREVRGG